jgi:hypothetical protein
MGEAYRRVLCEEKGNDMHRYISVGVLQSRHLHVRIENLKGREPAGKMILRVNLLRSFGRSGNGDEEERLRR